MDSARYYLALVLLMVMAPVLPLWIVIHPNVAFWRKLGPLRTYLVLMPPSVALSAGVFLIRNTLLAVDFGTQPVLIAAGVPFFLTACYLARLRSKQAKLKVIAGLPELAPDRYRGRLITEGVYARVRNPRYMEILLALIAYALFANFLGLYLLVLVTIPLGYYTVILEERELRARFGEEFEQYCRRVPRFLPRLR
jgi:protein-S-isoprenylcysteine O-methyltransferase Ste14